MRKAYESVGLTDIEDSFRELSIFHASSMGDTIEHINSNLKIIGYPTINELKKRYPDFKEDGSPDYLYEITFRKVNNHG